MKKIKYIIAVILGSVILVGSVSAATDILLSPLTVNVKQNQTFNVAVNVDPKGVKNYTVKVQLDYPADLLEVTGFNFGPTWMQLSQPGYDKIDNSSGTLIKTAGYPQGTVNNILFGTVTFRAKKTGSGNVSVSSSSTVLNQSSQNVFSGVLASTAVTVAVIQTPTPTPTLVGTVQTPTPRKTAVPGQPTVQPTQSPEVTESATPTPTVEPSTQQASILGTIGNKLDLGTDSRLVSLAVVLALVYGAYWLIRRKLKK